jgi:hypothetical protein
MMFANNRYFVRDKVALTNTGTIILLMIAIMFLELAQ